MICAVLFDLYGTLVDIKIDEDRASLWRELADWIAVNSGHSVDAGLLHRNYSRLCVEEAKIQGEGAILPSVFRELLGGGVNDEQIRSFAREFRRLSTQSFEVRPYTIPLLSRLRSERIRLALVSNTEGILTDYDIDRAKLEPLFDSILLSSDVGVAKPDPKILDKALRSISVASPNAVFVGDTVETDVAAAKALGMPCILITSRPGGLAPTGDNLIWPVRPVLQDIYAAIRQLLSHGEEDLVARTPVRTPGRRRHRVALTLTPCQAADFMT